MLPGTPSALIRLALRDLASCQTAPDYVVNMSVWHVARTNHTPCFVCLAGAVMAQSLYTASTQTVVPESFEEDTSDKLLALDYFREGYIYLGLHTMQVTYPRESALPHKISVAPYADPAQFREDMEHLATLLEQHNL